MVFSCHFISVKSASLSFYTPVNEFLILTLVCGLVILKSYVKEASSEIAPFANSAISEPRHTYCRCWPIWSVLHIAL